MDWSSRGAVGDRRTAGLFPVKGMKTWEVNRLHHLWPLSYCSICPGSVSSPVPLSASACQHRSRASHLPLPQQPRDFSLSCLCRMAPLIRFYCASSLGKIMFYSLVVLCSAAGPHSEDIGRHLPWFRHQSVLHRPRGPATLEQNPAEWCHWLCCTGFNFLPSACRGPTDTRRGVQVLCKSSKHSEPLSQPYFDSPDSVVRIYYGG